MCDNITVQCWELLDQFWPPIIRVSPQKTPFGLLLLLFQSQSHVTTFTRNYLLRCCTCTQLTITYTFVTTITCSTLTRLHSLRALHSNLYCTVAHSLQIYSMRLQWLTSQLLVTFTDYHTLSRTQSLHFTLRNSRRELTPRIQLLRILLKTAT
jgi:hypothetical protein